MKQTQAAFCSMCEWAVEKDNEASWGYQQLLDRIDWSGATDGEAASSPVADKYLKRCVDLAGDNPLGDMGRAGYEERDELNWSTMYQSYGDDERTAGVHDSYAIMVLSSPDGRLGGLPSDDVGGIFSIQGPDTWYPPHVHRQKEVYGIIGGRAEWQRGAEGWVERDTGETFYHPSGVRHETQTRNEPLLCFAAWIDHVHLPSIFVWA